MLVSRCVKILDGEKERKITEADLAGIHKANAEMCKDALGADSEVPGALLCSCKLPCREEKKGVFHASRGSQKGVK